MQNKTITLIFTKEDLDILINVLVHCTTDIGNRYYHDTEAETLEKFLLEKRLGGI